MENKNKLLNIYKNIDNLLNKEEKIIIAIEGSSGSGKSSLALELFKKYDCNLFHTDDFFLTPKQRTKERFLEIGGNIDYERFESQIAKNILQKKDFTYEIYNCHDCTFSNSKIISSKKINIVEGVYSLHPLFQNIYNFKIFLDIDYKTQKERILKRSGSELFERFVNEWIPLENLYFDKFEIRDKCNIKLIASS